MGTEQTVLPGQIWKENDPRNERYIRTITGPEKDHEGNLFVRVRGCNKDGGHVGRSRESWAKLERFNGKRSGYSFTGVKI